MGRARVATRTLTAAVGLALPGWAPVHGQSVLFQDDFEQGLARWDAYGVDAAEVRDSGDPVHGAVLVLRPNGDAHVTIPGSERWSGYRIEGSVLFPEEVHNYLGILYNLVEIDGRFDFGNVYLKGNGSYLQVNPHRDYNVGRLLYPELHVDLDGSGAIRIGAWQRFAVEVFGETAHVYVGEGELPWLTFSDLELRSGRVGLQPRSVGGDVWIDDVVVTDLDRPTYRGGARPERSYDTSGLILDWEVLGPFSETRDEVARNPAGADGWRPFAPDARGAVVTARIVDTLGPRRVAYFRTTLTVPSSGLYVLELSSIDDVAVWARGRFEGFGARGPAAWHDFLRDPERPRTRVGLQLEEGDNEVVVRVIGGVYAGGGFFAALGPRVDG